MRAGGVAGRADAAQHPSRPDPSVAHPDVGQVRVEEDHPVGADADDLAVAGDPAGGDDAAVGDRVDLGAIAGADVDPGVEAAPAPAVAGRDRTADRTDPALRLVRPPVRLTAGTVPGTVGADRDGAQHRSMRGGRCAGTGRGRAVLPAYRGRDDTGDGE